MNTTFILNELVSDFGISLNIQEKKFPDKDVVWIRPVDFPPRKGFTIINHVEWLSLTTYLEFEDFSKDILHSIMKNHSEKIGIMVNNIQLLAQKEVVNELQTNIEQLLNHNTEEPIDLTRISLSLHSPTMKIDKMSVEEYIIDHQNKILGIVLLLFDLEEIPGPETFELEGFPEGSKKRIEVNKYERSRINRQACLNYHGYSCKICNFNFKDRYGEIGRNFIHVHHLIPVSKLKESYSINPINDLIPVCPNCHVMIHSRNPPIEIQKLKDHLK